MLKALELCGFKSFADKTRFEFPAGITVVVGPNGSGKSNVVDAIKWVLGEQSAKSLRGQDMADVIFKGSGTSGRKPTNTAEATIVFDNVDRRLPIDAPEVHVTRRVYRSGEGEYLINRQPCRLKDIKDLFRGTGVGVDAYSLIEQGKVERLLQASAKDRRAMFEEAAGISRFKAKKVEAQRRLERVDQNMLRLSDIVEEVEGRLKSVRAQAGKAKRYREYSDRLQQLRTQVGLTDWRKLTEKLTGIEREIARLRDEAAAIAANSELQEARSLELETEISAAADAVRDGAGRVARHREQIVGLESSIEQQRSRGNDLDEEAVRHRQHVTAMSTRAGDLQERLREVTNDLERAETEHRAIAQQVADRERALGELTAQMDRLRADIEMRRADYVARMRQAATLGNQVSVHRSQLAVLTETEQRCRQRLDEIERSWTAQSVELARLREAEKRLLAELAALNELLAAAQRELAEDKRVQTRRQQDVVELLGRLSGAKERADLLADLEAKREGLGVGVKELLEAARDEPHGPFGEARGLVADIIQASVDIAPLVDVALGEAAQHVVVGGSRLIENIASGVYRPSGRVGLVLGQAPDSLAPAMTQTPQLDLQPGVLGRADRMVEVSAEFTPLVARLLGATWFVDDLATALELQASFGGQRFVTKAGQLLDGDGTVIAGPRQAAEGLVYRRSELRELQQRIAVLEWQIQEGQREVQRLQINIEAEERNLRQLTSQQIHLDTTLAEQRARTRSLDQRCEELAGQRTATEAEWHATQTQHADVARQLDESSRSLAAMETELATLDTGIRADDRRVETLDGERQQFARHVTAAKIEMAKSEQRLDGLRSLLSQFEQDQRERSRSLLEARTQLTQCLERRQLADRAILRATSELAELYLRKEAAAREVADHSRRREQLVVQRAAIADELNAHRRKLRTLEDQQHTQDLAAGEVRHERNTLVDRLKEDYGIDIAALEAPETGAELQQREQVEEEIAGLRKKINGLGAVNMDALAELDELEARFASLDGQFQDLKQAKEALERIITKINADSRRLFLETLEAIRVNFQGLYRRAFGGGKADITLEAGVDVLEAGVEIMATPPGKPSFNNSLLSGGEKALTAVALLLAIFQFRPSPFCVLDEVDAPFDEANIGRFIDVLKDFLSFTKFVIVTHSKKTMTAANTLYGVTMQESGVSKRVSVQFDDVSEDGHIRREAVDRESAAEPASGEEAA